MIYYISTCYFLLAIVSTLPIVVYLMLFPFEFKPYWLTRDWTELKNMKNKTRVNVFMAHATAMNMLVFVKKDKLLTTHVPYVHMNSSDSHEDTTYFRISSLANVCIEYAIRILNPVNKSHVRCK